MVHGELLHRHGGAGASHRSRKGGLRVHDYSARPRNVPSEVAEYLERDRPLAVILSSVVHHVPEELDPARIVREYTEILPPSSHIALDHYLDPADNPVAHRFARELENRFVHGLGSGWFRTGTDRLLVRRSGTGRTRSGRTGRLVASRSRSAPALAGGAADAGRAGRIPTLKNR
ncbi:SAM-dependent methyltransferase [Nocardia sp. NPDC004573]